MGRYLAKRILRGLFSVVIVVGVVMILIYSALDRELIFASDPVYSKQSGNGREVYKMQQWEKYGYVDYVPFGEYLRHQADLQDYSRLATIGNTPAQDDLETARWVRSFTEEYESRNYTVVRLNGQLKGSSAKYKDGGEPRLFAYRVIPVLGRLVRYFAGIVR